MKPPRIILTGGPYNGREIEDSGAVCIRMALVHRSGTPGTPCGYSVYIPNPDRARAFWDGNVWDGELVEENC